MSRSKYFRTLRCKSKLSSTEQIDKRLSIKTPKGVKIAFAVFISGLLLFSLFADLLATTVLKRNLVEMVSLADRIFTGEIVSVTDGIDAPTSAPYTEITIRLSERISGKFTGDYLTFRQFGLLKPRVSADPRYTNVMLTPPGFPTYQAGEHVLLFLCKEGSITRFCSPIGLIQGKFVLTEGRYLNGIANQDLFEGVAETGIALTEKEKKLLATKQGPVSADLLISLVKKLAQQY